MYFLLLIKSDSRELICNQYIAEKIDANFTYLELLKELIKAFNSYMSYTL